MTRRARFRAALRPVDIDPNAWADERPGSPGTRGFRLPRPDAAGALYRYRDPDGGWVYTNDPVKDPGAIRYEQLSYDKVLNDKLGVMDLTAICLCRDHQMPVCVFKMDKPGALLNIVVGKNEGTFIR